MTSPYFPFVFLSDMEMRLGFLGKPEHERVPQPSTAGTIHSGASASSVGHGHRSGSATPSQSGYTADQMMHMSSPFGGGGSSAAAHQGSPSKGASGGGSTSGGQFSWQGGEMGMTMKDGTHIPIETQGAGSSAAGKEEAVEMMSTDSSSSSSTDSN